MTLSWVKKYEPSTLLEVKGQNKIILQLNDFITSFKKQRKKAVMIYGPPGCGKTAVVIALAKQHNLEFVEVNASDFRNKAGIEEKIGNALKQQSLFSKGKIILIDEIDGLSGTKDRGGIPTIAKLVASSAFPVIMTANNPWDKKFNPLRSKSKVLELEQLGFETVYEVLKTICKKEKLNYEDKALRTLARTAGGDLRAAINDLQSFSTKKSFTTKDLEFLPERNREESMQNALIKIFKTDDARIALSAFDNVNENLDKSMLWLDQNLPQEYSPKDLKEAYNKLSKAHVYLGRIMRRQHWRFLVYANTLATAGIAVSKTMKNKKPITYKPTTRIFKLWRAKMKYQKRKAIAQKVASKTHTSTKIALQDMLPHIKTIFQNNPEQSLIKQFSFDEDEVEWLTQ